MVYPDFPETTEYSALAISLGRQSVKSTFLRPDRRFSRSLAANIMLPGRFAAGEWLSRRVVSRHVSKEKLLESFGFQSKIEGVGPGKRPNPFQQCTDRERFACCDNRVGKSESTTWLGPSRDFGVYVPV